MSPNPQFPADLVTFTEEILNGKPNFFVLSTHTIPTFFKILWQNETKINRYCFHVM